MCAWAIFRANQAQQSGTHIEPKVEQVERIIGLGVEKVAVSSAAIANLEFITDAAKKVGSQSIAVVADVRADVNGGYRVFTHNGTVQTNAINLSKILIIIT